MPPPPLAAEPHVVFRGDPARPWYGDEVLSKVSVRQGACVRLLGERGGEGVPGTATRP